MKIKHIAPFALMATIFAVSSCNSKTNDSTAPEAVNNETAQDSLRQALADQDSLLVLLTEISEGLDNIKRMENILTQSSDLTAETPNKRRKIRDDMAAIQQSIISNRARLAELESRLNKANNNNAHLRRAITALKHQITTQVATIQSLREELAQANIMIDRLTLNNDSLNETVALTVEERDEVIQENIDLTNELNICYYALGSKKELKDHKIIETGFLRKTKIMPSDFEHDYFTVADKRQLTALPLYSHKAEVLSNHPADSYTLSKGNDGNYTLTITNPSRFWSTSNYLVVKTD